MLPTRGALRALAEGWASALKLKRAPWRQLLLAGLAGPLLLVGGLAGHVFLDRRGLPDLAQFERFELPVTGQIQ